MYSRNMWHFEIKECFGNVCVLQHRVHHFQFYLIIVVSDLTVHKRVYFFKLEQVNQTLESHDLQSLYSGRHCIIYWL